MTASKCTLFFIFFACILHHFYLVDDIYITKPTLIYQYFIIYSVRYASVSLISLLVSDIRYEKTPSDTIPIFNI